MRFAYCALLLACGSKEPAQDKAAPVADKPPADKPAGSAVVVKPSPPAPAKLLLPADVDPSKPMPVTELHAALDVWKLGTRVAVAGYPKFFIGDAGKIGYELELAATAGGTRETKTLVQCRPKTDVATEVSNTEPVVIEGALDGIAGKDDKRAVSLTDCTLVSKGTKIADAPADPRAGTPIPIQKLYDVYLGWQGTEVSVTGHFVSITTSSAADKTTVIDVRVDLGTEELKALLGCHLAKQTPDPVLVEKLGKDRVNTVVRGKVSSESFGYPQLEPCAITNR
jgi:hypothetical protein